MTDQLTSPHIPAVGFVSELSKEDRDLLSSYGSFHLGEAGDTLIHEGESHGKLFFLISGLLHAKRNDDNRDVLLGAIHQGEWVGEVDLCDPGAAVCSVVIIEDAQYWMIARSDFMEFTRNYPEAGNQLLYGMASTLSKRLRGVTRKLMEETEIAAVRAALLENGHKFP
jgi:CRP-like cAMP-binding protein